VTSNFVHLRMHTEYSLVDSVVRVKPLLEAAASLDLPALALTDEGNVSAMVKFYRAAIRQGVKPIIGADVWLASLDDDRSPVRLTLLCMDGDGFKQLCQVLTKSHAVAPTDGRALVEREWLNPDAVDRLIALSGAQFGDIGRTVLGHRSERAQGVLEEWTSRFPGRFYIELQRLGRQGEAEYIERAVALAALYSVPVVATNDVRFLHASDFDAHETRVCIAQSRTLDDASRQRHYSNQQYLRSPQEMLEIFPDLPEACANTVEIAKRCSFELTLGEISMPHFAAPDGQKADEYLRQRSRDGLDERIRRRQLTGDARRVYDERLDSELGVICSMGFEGYFLIVADFIAWARDNNVPVGPGRGSGAGSLVAYVLGITDLDPLEHDLLFERFLNPERVSMPDFDIDFCIEGRDRVIEYVSQRYGRDRVSQIITYGTMAARAVVRDVGRALGHPFGYVDRIAKLIPFEIGITLDKALADDEELRTLYESDEEVQGLIDLAKELEGLARNAGTHAGGVVISPTPLTDSMPLYSDPNSASLTQLDKDDLEAIGLVKFDFLGLKTLTIIDKAVAAVNRQLAAEGKLPIDIDLVPMADEASYALLNRCQTTAVFQLESRGMRDLIKRIRPDRFEDLVAIVALFRPGPMHMADDFINRKQGLEAIDYLHPLLEPVLRSTYGVILYQEQVMQIAQVLAGYSLGGADLLRRAMGKKSPEEMAKQRSVFVTGATERGVTDRLAAHIFDLMEKFAGYGFNKSHSAAYALLAYKTAWLKAHFPEAFMAAVMTADMDNTDKLVTLKDDCKQLGIAIDPPNVNHSEFGFVVGGRRRIVYGLGAIKGVGQSVVESILAERTANGPFTGLVEFARRAVPHKANRRVLEALVRAGALDDLGANRATLMNAIGDTLQLVERSAQAAAAGQGTLFAAVRSDDQVAHVFEPVREWSKRERLEAERDSLGLYLTGHPFDDYAEHCLHFCHGSIANAVGVAMPTGNSFRTRRTATLAGAVMDMRRRGNRVMLVLDDDTERIEVTLFDEIYNQSRHVIRKHAVLVVDGSLRYDDFINGWRLTGQSVRSVDDAIEEYARRITISLDCESAGPELIGELKRVLAPHRNGNCALNIECRGSAGEARLVCGDDWNLRPTRELREGLSRLLGEDRYAIHYPKHFV
jgi:DNA polymerase-3 subunit alpha